MTQKTLEQCRECALRLLSQRPHSVGELRAKLVKRQYSGKDISVLVTDFERVGLLDDAEYARLYCEERLQSSQPVGERRVLQELWKRHIPAELAKSAMGQVVDDDEIATELSRAVDAAAKKLRVLRGQTDDPRKMREKVARFLGGRGFDGGVCWQAVDTAMRDAGISE